MKHFRHKAIFEYHLKMIHIYHVLCDAGIMKLKTSKDFIEKHIKKLCILMEKKEA